jgi:uncharacterized membrane protein YkvA (DUF1232 family)
MKTLDQFINEAKQFLDMAFSNKTPTKVRLLLLAALLYFLSPIDLIPDFIPVIGYLDDLIIVPTLIWMAFKEMENYKLAHRNEEVEEAQIISDDNVECQEIRK